MKLASRRIGVAELKELREIMVKGNTLLKECAEMMGMQHKKFRGALFGNRLDTSNLTPEQLKKLQDAIPAILEVRNKCEQPILEGFSRMVMHQAYVAASHTNDPINMRKDFQSAGMAALLDAVYSYTNMDVKLSSFIWPCIQRRIHAEANKLNPLCPLTNEALELVIKFEVEKSRLNTIRHHTDDEIADSLGLTAEQRTILFSATTKVINESRGSQEGDENADYTSLRHGIDKDYKEVEVDRSDVRQALKDAALNSFELDVILADLFPYHGWQEHVASKHVNEKTGKRFTRQNVQFVLERAKKKVRETLLHPPEEHRENLLIDKLFDEMSGIE